MKNSILYIDPFSGVSGDMLLGAFLSLGVSIEVVRDAVEAVIPGEVALSPTPVARSGLAGLLCEVKVIGGPGKRTLGDMMELVRGSGLSDRIIQGAVAVLGALGEAERAAHGKPEGPVHLHELGGQDTLTDIVGALAALEDLKPGTVRCGPVNLGKGYVQTSHGQMPVPAPATAQLLSGMLVTSEGPEAELTTPTGAAILSEIVQEFAPLGPMMAHRTGSGAGTMDFRGFPNLLRMFLGARDLPVEDSRAVVIECGVDDASPEYLAPATGLLQEAGAKEVHIIPALTKKGRMGVLVRVLASESQKEELIDAVFDTTGTAGLRYWPVHRAVLDREMIAVKTPYGTVSFKRWCTPSGQCRFKPEFEDIRKLAEKAGIPPARMRDLAVAAYVLEVGDGQQED